MALGLSASPPSDGKPYTSCQVNTFAQVVAQRRLPLLNGVNAKLRSRSLPTSHEAACPWRARFPVRHHRSRAPRYSEPSMVETKTKPRARASMRTSPPEPLLSSRDCEAVMAMCKRVTKQQPKMWGPARRLWSYTYRYGVATQATQSYWLRSPGKELVATSSRRPLCNTDEKREITGWSSASCRVAG